MLYRGNSPLQKTKCYIQCKPKLVLNKFQLTNEIFVQFANTNIKVSPIKPINKTRHEDSRNMNDR